MNSTKKCLFFVGVVFTLTLVSAAPSLNPHAGSKEVLSKPDQVIRRFDGTVEDQPTSRNTIRRYITSVRPGSSKNNVILFVNSNSSQVSIAQTGEGVVLFNFLSDEDEKIKESIEKLEPQGELTCIFFDFENEHNNQLLSNLTQNNLFLLVNEPTRTNTLIEGDEENITTKFYTTRWLKSLIEELRSHNCEEFSIELKKSAVLKGLKDKRPNRKLTINILDALRNEFCDENPQSSLEVNKNKTSSEVVGDKEEFATTTPETVSLSDEIIAEKIDEDEENVNELLPLHGDGLKISTIHTPTLKDINVIIIHENGVIDVAERPEMYNNSIFMPPPPPPKATEPQTTTSLMKNVLQVGIDIPELSQRWTNALKAFGLSALPTAAVAAVLTWPAAPALLAALGRKKRSIDDTDPASLCREFFEKLLATFGTENHFEYPKKRKLKKRLVKLRRKKPAEARNKEIVEKGNNREIQSFIRSLWSQFSESRSSQLESKADSSSNVDSELESTNEGKSIVTRRRNKPIFHTSSSLTPKTLLNSNPEPFEPLPDIEGRIPQVKNPASLHVLPVSQNADFDIVANFVEKTYNKFLDTDQKVKDDIFVINKPQFGETRPDKVVEQKIESALLITDNKEKPSKGSPAKIQISKPNPLMIPTGKVTPSPITYYKVKPFIPPSGLSEEKIHSLLSQLNKENSSKLPPSNSKPPTNFMKRNFTSFTSEATLPPTTPPTRLQTKATRRPFPAQFFVDPAEVPYGLNRPTDLKLRPANSQSQGDQEQLDKLLLALQGLGVSLDSGENLQTMLSQVKNPFSDAKDSNMQAMYDKVLSLYTLAPNDDTEELEVVTKKPSLFLNKNEASGTQSTSSEKNPSIQAIFDQMIESIAMNKPSSFQLSSLEQNTPDEIQVQTHTERLPQQQLGSAQPFSVLKDQYNLLKDKGTVDGVSGGALPGKNKDVQEIFNKIVNSISNNKPQASIPQVTSQPSKTQVVDSLVADDEDYYDSSSEEDITVPPRLEIQTISSTPWSNVKVTSKLPFGNKPNRFFIQNIPVIVNSTKVADGLRESIRNLTQSRPDVQFATPVSSVEANTKLIPSSLIASNPVSAVTSEQSTEHELVLENTGHGYQQGQTLNKVQKNTTTTETQYTTSTIGIQIQENQESNRPVTEGVKAELDIVVDAVDAVSDTSNQLNVEGSDAVVVDADFSSQPGSSGNADANVAENNGTRILSVISSVVQNTVGSSSASASSSSSSGGTVFLSGDTSGGLLVSGNGISGGTVVSNSGIQKTTIGSLGWPLGIFLASVAVYVGAAAFPFWIALRRKKRRNSNLRKDELVRNSEMTKDQLVDGLLMAIMNQVSTAAESDNSGDEKGNNYESYQLYN